MADLSFLLFQEPWWLSAVTNGRYDEVTFKQGGQVVGRFPFVATRRGPWRVSLMPPFTHMIGPVVEAGVGKPQTQLVRRLSIIRALVDQLPPFAFFKQIVDPSIASGLAAADGLAFQDRGFELSPQYTFRIDCRGNLKDIWDGMHFKVRQHIRSAQQKYSVVVVDDPNRFVHFYLENIKRSAKQNRIDFCKFPELFSQCQTRNSGEILAAIGANGAAAAMVYLVWGRGVMYYLLSTRSGDIGDNGSVNLLLWSAIDRAHQRSLILDFDGVYSSGTARFLSGFGGVPATRTIVRRTQTLYRALQYSKSKMFPGDGNSNFT